MKIVKLGASWCMPCKVLERTIEQIKADEKYKDIEFISYDVEKDKEGSELAASNGVTGVPTMLFFDDNNNIVFKVVGNIPKKDVETAIHTKLLNSETNKKENNETA